MSMLIEKRNELMLKLESLELARKSEINDKVEAYRAALEAQTSKDGIEKVKNVISALDEVIAYDASIETKPEPAPVAQTTSFEQVVESRPGMTSVFTPSRN